MPQKLQGLSIFKAQHINSNVAVDVLVREVHFAWWIILKAQEI